MKASLCLKGSYDSQKSSSSDNSGDLSPLLRDLMGSTQSNDVFSLIDDDSFSEAGYKIPVKKVVEEALVKTHAKSKKLNHTFEKEMLLATTYRDAFLERKLAVKKKLELDSHSKKFKQGSGKEEAYELDEGEIVVVNLASKFKEKKEKSLKQLNFKHENHGKFKDKIEKSEKKIRFVSPFNWTKKGIEDDEIDVDDNEIDDNLEKIKHEKRLSDAKNLNFYNIAGNKYSEKTEIKTEFYEEIIDSPNLKIRKKGQKRDEIDSISHLAVSKSAVFPNPPIPNSVILDSPNSVALDTFQDSKDQSGMTKNSSKNLPEVGVVNIRIKCVRTNMIYYVGDTVYEEKMAQLYDIENAKHLVKDKKYFDSAVTRQSTVNKDSMFLLESTTTGGKFIQPYFIVDIHSPCVHSLLNSLNAREKKPTVSNSTFGQSNVLVAMKEVYDAISMFSKNGEFRALAGGGVIAPIPPSVKKARDVKKKAVKGNGQNSAETDGNNDEKHYYGHPSIGLPRSIAFPLCQEFLIANLDETLALAKAPIERTHHHTNKPLYQKSSKAKEGLNYNLSYAVEATNEPLKWTNKTLLKKYDSKSNLLDCLEKDGEDSGYWGGAGYIKDTVYSDISTLTRGYMDASTLYCPSLVASKGDNKEKGRASIQSETDEDEDPEVTKMKSRTQAALKKIRAARSGVEGILKTGYNFWNSLPCDLLRKTAYNADVETIELLLAKASQLRDGKALNLVVWVLGVCPPPTAIEKASRLFERQALANDQTALLVVLASETEVELDEENPDTLKRIASPFKPFLNCYINAVKKAVGDTLNEDDDEDIEMDGIKYERHGTKNPSTSRLMLQHWMSWQEVVAQAFVSEDKANAKLEKNGIKIEQIITKNKSKFDLLKRKKKPVAQEVGKEKKRLEGKEGTEYPTHLSIRRVMTDKSFVGLSHHAADRVLGVLYIMLNKAEDNLDMDDDEKGKSSKKFLGRLVSTKSISNSKIISNSSSTYVSTKSEKAGTQQTGFQNENQLNTLLEDENGDDVKVPIDTIESGIMTQVIGAFESAGKDKEKEAERLQLSSKKSLLKNSFFSSLSFRQSCHVIDASEVDGSDRVDHRVRSRSIWQGLADSLINTPKVTAKNENYNLDKNEINRLQEEKKDSVALEKELGLKRVKDFKELMTLRERFELERTLVQRGEIRKFICQVFSDLVVVENENKIKEEAEGIFGTFGRFFGF
mmetsp:Transcript_10439/g.10061  ORF Transcript_10439/g.10061 Transcript_10439/m.10061 type:complete len:1210 (+) Transcript_10439:1354-4983(+)|eukprot:CAMPEP_0119051632 /NCGR_PEP_ID=MMETSP1177-20130426/73184_1 /TAXON_ID=2985 /ORGANISM="Ochromonas sp, Strain CCMP1899" /LENGTH=1209 /DNA_ID=CAMNT_0007030903 /DNA_START=1281 /DNA_END=4910 /DNA_ORIENTATION=+